MQISAIIERFAVAGSFNISRGAKTHVDVLTVSAQHNGALGMGESTAIYYEGESAQSALSQVTLVMDKLADLSAVEARDKLQSLLPAGSARNACDAALWDLESKISGRSLANLAGLSEPKPLITAFTISLNDHAKMQSDAADAAAKGYNLLKLKLTGEGDIQRVAAVRAGAPDARLIVDANESWGGLDIAAQASELAALGVEMIEQPVPHGQDHLLAGVKSPVPLCADESCHSAADVANCAQYYDVVNIKLDKSGGLTEALKILEAAKEHNLKIMVGCMLSTSLGIAPAYLVAQNAHWVDLDGPALLAKDREDGFIFKDGMISEA